MEAYLLAGGLLYFLTQIAPGHVLRLRLAQHRQHRWRDVAQRAAALQAHVIVVRYQKERNWIGSVIRVRASGSWVDHRFRIAIIRGDDPRAATRRQLLLNPRQAD